MLAGGKGHSETKCRFPRFLRNAPRSVVLSGAGTAVRSAAGLTAPAVSYLIQAQHSQIEKCCQR